MKILFLVPALIALAWTMGLFSGPEDEDEDPVDDGDDDDWDEDEDDWDDLPIDDDE